jgi:hypothetical protein
MLNHLFSMCVLTLPACVCCVCTPLYDLTDGVERVEPKTEETALCG